MRHFAPMLAVVCLGMAVATSDAADKPKTDTDKEADPFYYHDGPLAGSLKRDGPLPIFDADIGHLWNRLFAAFFIRRSALPEEPGGEPVQRIEGGDLVDLLAWPTTTYWSEPAVFERVDRLLDEFREQRGERMIAAPLPRAVFQNDLWAAYDLLAMQNIRRFGTPAERQRRDVLCGKLAATIQALALPREEIGKLPLNYSAAIGSGKFATEDGPAAGTDYLPPRLLSQESPWVEIEFYQPEIHEDIDGRFITLHTRNYRGRSYFRVFYRFPGGRGPLKEYLRYLDAEAVDWKTAAKNGFIVMRKGIRQIPVGTQVALVQLMMVVDDQMRPAPTPIVQSIRLRTFPSVDLSDEPATNTGLGMNVYEYTLRRRLLLDHLRQGGLVREPDEMPQYRVIFQPRNAPDWGPDGRVSLFEQCIKCHVGTRYERPGVHSIVSIINSGGFGAGAQLGVAVPLEPERSDLRARRAARWKERDETFRRLLEYVGR